MKDIPRPLRPGAGRTMLQTVLMLILLALGGCSQGPRVELMGDTYYLSPFPHEKTKASSPAGAPAEQ